MRKRSEPKTAARKMDEALRDVCEIDLSRVRGSAGNAAIDFAIKRPV